MNGKNGLSNRIRARIDLWNSSATFYIFDFKKYRMNGKKYSVINRKSLVWRNLAAAVLMRLEAFIMLGDNQKVEELARDAISRGIKNTDILTHLGKFYFDQRCFDLAEKAFLDVLQEDNQNGTANFFLGYIRAEYGDLGTSIKYFLRSTSSAYEVNAWCCIGNLLCYLGNMRGAIASWDQAAQKVPEFVKQDALQKLNAYNLFSPVEHFKLGLAYYWLGEINAAKTGFEIAVKEGQFTTIGRSAGKMLSLCS